MNNEITELKLGDWIFESQLENVKTCYQIKETLFEGKSEFQKVQVFDTYDLGRMLVLDGIVQTTIKDEFIYHEMMAHTAAFAHKNPKTALVVGGGDGGVVRELLKHKSLEKIVLCEIDSMVIYVSKKYLAEISSGLNDPRCEVVIADGIKFVHAMKNEFDLIFVDSTDPFGAAEGLFGGSFYKELYNALTDDGLFIAQTETPFYLQEVVKKVNDDAKEIFPITKLLTTSIPTYPGGFWSFTLASKKYDPSKINNINEFEISTKYYNKDLHRASFVLPNYLKNLLK